MMCMVPPNEHNMAHVQPQDEMSSEISGTPEKPSAMKRAVRNFLGVDQKTFMKKPNVAPVHIIQRAAVLSQLEKISAQNGVKHPAIITPIIV